MAISDFRVHPEPAATAIAALLSKHSSSKHHVVKTLGGFKVLAEGETLPTKMQYAKVEPAAQKKVKSPAEALGLKTSPHFVPLKNKPVSQHAFESKPSMQQIEKDALKKNPFVKSDPATLSNFKKIQELSTKAKKLDPSGEVQKLVLQMINNSKIMPIGGTPEVELAAEVLGCGPEKLPHVLYTSAMMDDNHAAINLQNKWHQDIVKDMMLTGNVTYPFGVISINFKHSSEKYLDVWLDDGTLTSIGKGSVLAFYVAFDGQVPVVFVKMPMTVIKARKMLNYVVAQNV